MYKIYDNFDSADKFVDLLLPLSTYTRKSAQQKKSRPQSRPLKIPKKSSLKKKIGPKSATKKNNQDSNYKQPKARQYVVFYKEVG